jgi:hypothetical protein
LIKRFAEVELCRRGAARAAGVRRSAEAFEVVFNDVMLAGQLLTALRGKTGEARVLNLELGRVLALPEIDRSRGLRLPEAKTPTCMGWRFVR